MKNLIYLLLFFTLVNSDVFAQGCVAIRSNGSSCAVDHMMLHDSTASKWQLSTSYRYFKSFRHFKGRTEQVERLEKKTEVINWSHSLDITLTRQLKNGWAINAGIPILYNDRSSLYEHGLKERHTSSSKGIGDLRLTVSKWIFNKAKKGNIQASLGIKLPSGNYNYKDEFQNVGPEGKPESRPVDQSIQLGDGGVGAIIDVNGYYNLTKQFSAYTNLYYLINPRDDNGTRTYLETISAKFNDDRRYMSVPDQYMVRGGVNYSLRGILTGIGIGGGVRIEGLPAKDLIGDNNGWRRPGYIVSAEPVLNYSFKSVNLFAAVPIALQRNRIQSVHDKRESEVTGTKVVGDAAFADYSVSVGASFRF